MNISGPGAPVWHVVNAEAFNGTSPAVAAWTDLDLSAIVGARSALVILKAYNPNAAVKHFVFRPNGETELVNYSSHLMGIYQASALGFGSVLCYTDDAGILEWMYQQISQAGVIIDVMAFLTND